MNSSVLPQNSLKNKITLCTLIIFLLSLWSLSYYASQMLRKDIVQMVGEQQFSTATLLAAEINKEFGNRIHALELDAAKISPAMLSNPGEAQAYFERLPIIQSFFNAGIMVLGVNGKVIADIPRSGGRIGLGYKDRDDVILALNEGKSSVGTPHLSKRHGTPEFAMAMPIRDSQGKVTGVLRGEVNLGKSNFLNTITDYRYGKTGGYLLVAPKQRLIVTSTDKSRIMEQLPAQGINPLVDRFVGGYEGTQVGINPVGVEVLTSAKGIPAADWYLVSFIPTEEAFAPIHDMERRMMVATIILTLLAGALTWWLLRRNLLPLMDTVEALSGISDTSKDLKPLPVVRQDEIGKLIVSFNYLLDKLGKRETALLEGEERARKLAALLRLMCDNVPDMIWAKDLEKRFIFSNQANCTRLLGATDTTEPEGKTHLYFSQREREGRPDYAEWYTFGEQCQDTDAITLERGIPSVFEESGYVKGKFLCLEVHKAPFLDSNGVVIGTVGSARDITERKQAERELRSAERHLARVVEGSNEGFWEWNLLTNSFVTSARFESMLGYQSGEMNLSPEYWANYVEAGDLAKSNASIARHLAGETKLHEVEIRCRAKSGDWR